MALVSGVREPIPEEQPLLVMILKDPFVIVGLGIVTFGIICGILIWVGL